MTSIFWGRFTKKVAYVAAGLVAQDPDRELYIVHLSMGFRLSVSQAIKELCAYSKREEIQVKRCYGMYSYGYIAHAHWSFSFLVFPKLLSFLTFGLAFLWV